MRRHPDYTRERLHQLAERMRARIWADAVPVEDLMVSGPVDRIRWPAPQELDLRPARRGDQFDPPWATFWFRARATVPADWAGRRVDLLWLSHSEATLWREGRVVQGLNHMPSRSPDGSTRPDALLLERARGGEELELWIEMACNRLFGQPRAEERSVQALSPFVLERCDLAAFDQEAWDLYFDLEVLRQLEAAMTGDMERSRAGELLAGLNAVANRLDPGDRATWAPARDALAALYHGAGAGRVLELSAIGHAHIDTAWLWPMAESRRKCERTFSSQLAYMDRYPEHVFAVSQAVQWAWMKEQNPALYERMRTRAREGRFVPAGGTWVEPDCNIPSGESLVRQFLLGQRFFERELGRRCTELWQPDVFGYSGQLPQIMRGAGVSRFLTQKLSWNRFNRPHHHTFDWEGIDGSTVLAHFPPADSYSSVCDVAELRRAARDYKDHDRSRHAALLFGHGDGGGGPTPRMLEVLRRARDLDGLPRVALRRPDELFDALEADGRERARVVGELYFEFHRGTYTSVAAIKQANRTCEQLLRDAELLSAVAHRAGACDYPAAELERLWQLVLVHQFHDVLPGTSIAEVYEDARRDHREVIAAAERLRDRALAALASPGGGGEAEAVTSTASAPRAEVVDRDGAPVFVETPPCGVGRIAAAPDRVAVSRAGERTVLENEHLRAELLADGSLASLVHRASGREALDGPAGLLELYDDEPVAWDAWDIDPFHLETGRPCPPADRCEIAEQHPLRAAIALERRIGASSRARQTVSLSAGARRLEVSLDIDWQESHRLLKVAYPLAVRAMNATYEIQFGALERPTHTNTPYDLARYEVPGHRFADLSEHGFGVALLAHAKYGWSCQGSTLRLSLLRAPEWPAPGIDRGRHRIRWAVLPHAGTWQSGGVVAEAERFDTPVLWGGRASGSWLTLDTDDLVIDAVKKAEDSDALIVRLHECHGARGTARLTTTLPVAAARRASLLEEPGDPLPCAVGAGGGGGGGAIEIAYRPWEIITVALD